MVRLFARTLSRWEVHNRSHKECSQLLTGALSADLEYCGARLRWRQNSGRLEVGQIMNNQNSAEIIIRRDGIDYGAEYSVSGGMLHLKTHTETRSIELGDQEPEELARHTLTEIVDGQSSAPSAPPPGSYVPLGSYANVRQQVRQVDAWVKGNPWLAVAVAALVGRYLGVRRRRVI
jgi:hypothetical protein